MLARIGVLLVFASATASATPEPQQGVMLHVYPRDGVFHYAPDRVEVLPNATVVLGHIFGNHSLSSAEGLFNSTGNATSWPSVRAPSTPGTYRFYCWIHATPDATPEAGMAGILVVTTKDASLARESHDRPASGPPFVGIGVLLAGAIVRLRSKIR